MKKIFALVLVISVVVTFAACGSTGKNEESTTTTGGTAMTPVKVDYGENAVNGVVTHLFAEMCDIGLRYYVSFVYTYNDESIGSVIRVDEDMYSKLGEGDEVAVLLREDTKKPYAITTYALRPRPNTNSDEPTTTTFKLAEYRYDYKKVEAQIKEFKVLFNDERLEYLVVVEYVIGQSPIHSTVPCDESFYASLAVGDVCKVILAEDGTSALGVTK